MKKKKINVTPNDFNQQDFAVLNYS
jgi:hypothetical protein